MHTCKLYVRQYPHEPEPEPEDGCWYPEYRYGLTVHELISNAIDLLQYHDSIVTTSEHIMLLALHFHANQVINLELYSGLDRLRIDEEGELVDGWPGGFFDQRMPMLFGRCEGDETPITKESWAKRDVRALISAVFA